MAKKWYQHGDVTIKPARIPKEAKEINTNVLMDGELTGHKHIVVGDHNIFAEKGTLYLQANGEVIVRHEEHKPITLPKDTYIIGQVREYDFFEKQIRAIKD